VAHSGRAMTEQEIRATFAGIIERWRSELREWNSERLTKHPFVVNHVGYEADTSMPAEPDLPRAS
jgi:hypothetical protein